MGRLFQYNRLGQKDTNGKDNASKSSNFNRQVIENSKSLCPAYAELYPEFNVKKYSTNDEELSGKGFSSHQWSNRIQCLSSSRIQAGYPGERELLMSAVKRTKVYNCMRDFVKRRLFHQNCQAKEDQDEVTSDYEDNDVLDSSYNADEENDDDDYENASDECECLMEAGTASVTRPASSYHKLRSSKKSSKSRIGPLGSALTFSCWQQSQSHAESATSGSQCSTNTNTDTDDDSSSGSGNGSGNYRVAHSGHHQHHHEISDDAGISDCCQLITTKIVKKKQPKLHNRKSKHIHNKKKSRRFHLANDAAAKPHDDGIDSDELSELLDTSWYQPRITTKAAFERLEQSRPGSFLVRRKARTFELCLRSATKVKQFTVIANPDETYKLKGAKKHFSSLKALVTHHSVMAEHLPLTLALPRETLESFASASLRRCSDDFDTFESLRILDILQGLEVQSALNIDTS